MRTNTRKFRLTLIWVTLLALVLSLGLGLSASAQGPGDWTEYSGNPIFGESVGGPKAYYPSVLYDADEFSGHGASARYKMWYGTSGSTTGLATSDDGISWTNQGVVMTNGYHATVEYYPDGFSGVNSGDNSNGNTMYYRMWYWDPSHLYDVAAIGYTESPDGVTWHNDQPCQNGAVPIVSGVHPEWNYGSYGPCDVLYNSSASNTGTDWTFTMYYDGTTGGTESIGLAFSSNGIIWTGYDADSNGKADPVLTGTGTHGDWDENYVSRATIIKNTDDDYEMWYSGGVGAMDHGIGYATSPDGIHWTRDAGNPIFHKDDGVDWRDNRTYCPAVLKDGSSYKMWFTGKDIAEGKYSIGYATPPPEIVWVDDDWTCQDDVNIYDSSLTWQYNAFSSLQDGIDAVPSGTASKRSIVNVFNGDYQTSGQTIGGYATGILVKNLDYLTIQAVPGNEPTAKPLAGASLGIENSDHVIIDNIDLDGSLAGFDRLHVRNSDYITLKNSEIAFGIDGIDVETGGKHFVIENNVLKSLSGDAVDFSDGAYSDITIQDNIFHSDNRRPILIRNLGALPIGDFIIRRNISLGTNDQEAFRIIGASNVLIENNVIANSRQQGLYIDTISPYTAGGTPCSNITVQHNTFFNNGSDPEDNGEIKTKVTSSDIVIKNNIIYGNGSNPAFQTSVTPLLGEDSNLVYNTVDGSFIFGLNTITGSDPLFVSTAAGSEDLHLQAGSPAIEAGTDLGVSDDVEKNSRPNPAGTDPDIGAYEVGRPAPREAKQGVISDLSALPLTGDKKIDDGIKKAIEHIQRSIDIDPKHPEKEPKHELWLDDDHLDPKHGKKVFDKEKKAVHELMEIVKAQSDYATDAQTAIDTLVGVDALLAQTAIDEAIDAGGDPKEIAKAEEEMTKALEELDHTKKDGTPDPHYDKAIDHYKKAWEYACKAQEPKKHSSKPQAIVDQLQVVAYPNPIRDVHTATFQVMGTMAAEVEEIRVHIYDLSGHLVWEDGALGSELDWHTDSLSGDYLANGIYLYRVQIRIGGSWINQDIGKIAVLR